MTEDTGIAPGGHDGEEAADFRASAEENAPDAGEASRSAPGNGEPGKEPKAKRTGLVLLIILSVAALAVGAMQIASARQGAPGRPRGDSFPGISLGFSAMRGDHVAVIHVEGVIEEKNETYDQAWIIDTIAGLADDDNNTGILLYIDSPGGGVYQSDELYLELVDYKEKSGRPVWAYLGPTAASGGYYVACAADYICSNRNTLTGSIGVIAGQSLDLSGLMERHGIKMDTFTAGRNKDMLGINVPVTPEQREIMQSVADECYDQFTAIVSESRGLPPESVVRLADGRVYTAAQALRHGLVDEIARFPEAADKMLEENGLQSSELVHYYPESELSLYDYIIGSIGKAAGILGGNAGETGAFKELSGRSSLPDIPYPAYYYHR